MNFLRGRSITFMNARVVGPDGALARSLRIDGSRIAALDELEAAGQVVDLENAFVFPGLINPHDHLELNHFPRLKWRPHYESAREWIADFQPRFTADPVVAAGLSHRLSDRLLIGGLKNLLSGVTTVCHHNPMYRELGRRFPVRIVERFGFSHSLHIDGPKVRDSFLRTRSAHPWIIHAAEGVDEEATGEVGRLLRLGCLGSNTLLVHGVGLTPADREHVLSRGAGLIWCPGSNRFLFGRTADVSEFARRGRLAIGTDSRLSGERDLLRELKVAREMATLEQRALVRAVTCDAATLLRLPTLGRLQARSPADILVLRSHLECPFEALVAADRSDVALTMVGGQPRVGEPTMAAAFDAVGIRTVRACLDGRPRILDSRIATRLARSGLQEPGFTLDGSKPLMVSLSNDEHTALRSSTRSARTDREETG
ncbi:MAG: amidohydrolase family protein [Acidobacteria bacterium]|nr:amidohydrolase family protein [Acidobacteriota bacterium]